MISKSSNANKIYFFNKKKSLYFVSIWIFQSNYINLFVVYMYVYVESIGKLTTWVVDYQLSSSLSNQESCYLIRSYQDVYTYGVSSVPLFIPQISSHLIEFSVNICSRWSKTYSFYAYSWCVNLGLVCLYAFFLEISINWQNFSRSKFFVIFKFFMYGWQISNNWFI